MMLEQLRALLGGRASFYPFENRILQEVQSRLGDESRTQFERQIRVINKVQRLADGKEVNLYQMRQGKPAFDDSLRFPSAADEELLATVTLSVANSGGKLKAEVWLAKGRLFSLAFNKPPKQFFAGSNLKAVQAEITDVRIWFDPMYPHPVDVNKSGDASMLTGWLREWWSKGYVADLHAPLSPSERATYLARIDAQLPSDYLKLVAQTEGVRLMTLMVSGVAGIRQVVWPETNYYIIAEMEGLGALTVKDGEQSGELYLLHYEDNVARSMGTTFHKAVAELLKLD